MKPIRVMQLMWGFEIGGAERFVLNFIRKLDRRQWDPAVTIFQEDGPLRAEAETLGVPVYRIARGPVPVMTWKLWLAVRRFQPRLLHAHSMAPGLYASVLRAMTRATVITTRHGRPKSSPWSLALYLPARFTNRFIAVSEDVRQLLHHHCRIPLEDTYTVINGIDADAFAIRRPDGYRRALGVPEDTFLFGTVGRLDASKAQTYMIQAMRLLLDRGRKVHLAIAGDGQLREELQAEIDDLGVAEYVRLLGVRTDVPEFLASLDAFVLSSVDEGVPLSLLEAYAAGLPSVATRVGGIPEVVTHGEDGLLALPGDAAALANEMERLLTDAELCRHLAENAAQKVRAEFSIDHMVARYEAHYHDLLGTGWRPPALPALPAPGPMATRMTSLIQLVNDRTVPGPCLAIESDDWGLAGMPDGETYGELTRCRAASPDNIWATDSLEAEEDLEQLAEVLGARPDGLGRPLAITANFVTANPDLQSLESGRCFNWIPLDAHGDSNPVRPTLREAWKQMMAEGLLCPEYHGVWHMAPEALMALWRAGDPAVRAYARHNVRPPGLTSGQGLCMLSEYMQWNGVPVRLQPRRAVDQQALIDTGVEIFARVFGRVPAVTVAPHYLWNITTEHLWRRAGMVAVQGVNRHPAIRKPMGFLQAARLAAGRVSSSGLVYLSRNCRFEPALYNDTAERVFREVVAAFETRRPAVLCSHRINYSGKLNPGRRDRALHELGRLLDRVRAAYPNVRFVTSAELAEQYRTPDRASAIAPVLMGRLRYLGGRVIKSEARGGSCAA